MNPSRITPLVGVALVIAVGSAAAGQPAIEQLQAYRLQGVEQMDVARGRQLWYSQVNERGCSLCHGESPVDIGQHASTGKKIAPMAPSVNSERYQSAKKIEKWFLRNCKWTFGRECNLQEKADILAWLASQ